MIKICIVHFNTPELTQAAVRSIRKHTPDTHITIFDNSDRRPFGAMEGVTVIDNTKGQIINFDKWLRSFPHRLDQTAANNWASAKHCYTIQWLIDHTDGPFLLMDSDVLVKSDLTPLWDERQVFVGKVVHCKRKYQMVDLVYPFVCFLNVPMIKASGVTYFRGDRMYALTQEKPYIGYDTGAWFLDDCRQRGLPYKEVDINDYILHFGQASWKNRDGGDWLREHRDLH